MDSTMMESMDDDGSTSTIGTFLGTTSTLQLPIPSSSCSTFSSFRTDEDSLMMHLQSTTTTAARTSSGTGCSVTTNNNNNFCDPNSPFSTELQSLNLLTQNVAQQVHQRSQYQYPTSNHTTPYIVPNDSALPHLQVETGRQYHQPSKMHLFDSLIPGITNTSRVQGVPTDSNSNSASTCSNHHTFAFKSHSPWDKLYRYSEYKINPDVFQRVTNQPRHIFDTRTTTAAITASSNSNESHDTTPIRSNMLSPQNGSITDATHLSLSSSRNAIPEYFTSSTLPQSDRPTKRMKF